MADQIRREGNFEKMTSAFYTEPGGIGGIASAEAWIEANRKPIPCKPGAVSSQTTGITQS
jgi:hypothetical protein